MGSQHLVSLNRINKLKKNCPQVFISKFYIFNFLGKLFISKIAFNLEEERNKCALTWPAIKRNKSVEQILILYNMAKTVKTVDNLIPLFFACKKDLESLMIDFRFDQCFLKWRLSYLGERWKLQIQLGALNCQKGAFTVFSTTCRIYRL